MEMYFTGKRSQVQSFRGRELVQKPVVTYTDSAHPLAVGEFARVLVLDHPRFAPRTWLWTSTVLKVDGLKFETRNTHYLPGIIDESPALTTKTEEKA